MLEKNPFLVVNEKHFVLQCSRVEGSVFDLSILKELVEFLILLLRQQDFQSCYGLQAVIELLCSALAKQHE